MSLNTLNHEELDKAAEFFGVEFTKGLSKANKVKELELDGVTFESYKNFLVPDEVEETVVETPEGDLATVEAAPVVREEQILMVMERANPTYEIHGYRFTREHPFQLVLESDANKIMTEEKGFRPAMPAEAREFYG